MRYTIGQLVLVVGYGALVSSCPAGAEEPLWRGAVFGAAWTETNLPELPGKVITGRLTFHPAYFTSVELSRVIARDLSVPTPFGSWRGHDLEIGGQVVKHWGRQRHVELTAALVWRTPDWQALAPVSINFALGGGLSVALKRPRWERGPTGIRGRGSRHLQFHLLAEVELTPQDVPDWHLVLRLHHRSGIWGLISPRHTGSNYLGLGIRHDF